VYFFDLRNIALVFVEKKNKQHTLSVSMLRSKSVECRRGKQLELKFNDIY